MSGCKLLSSLVAVFALATPLKAEILPSWVIQGRELYVGCSLLINGSNIPNSSIKIAEAYSADTCRGLALNELSQRKRHFCLTKGPASQNPIMVMAMAYLEFFEANASTLADMTADVAFPQALAEKFPCR